MQPTGNVTHSASVTGGSADSNTGLVNNYHHWYDPTPEYGQAAVGRMPLLKAYRHMLLLFCLCAALLGTALAQDVLCDEEARHCTGFVAVGKARRGLTIPVEAAGRRLRGLIDTGSAWTIFDTSLRDLLKGDAEPRTAVTPAGEISLDHYKAPTLILAGSEVGESRLDVACTDLTPFRRAAGEPIDLILGMDVLRYFTISIYSRDGVVSCERSSTRRGKGGIDISCDEYGIPLIAVPTAHLPPGVDVRAIVFQIDTGFVSPVDGALSHGLFEQLLECDALTPYGMGKGVGLSGTPVEQRDGRLQGNLVLPGRVCREPRFVEAEYNILGLGVLLRYDVILDLRNCRAYFSVPGQDVDDAKARRHARGQIERVGRSKPP